MPDLQGLFFKNMRFKDHITKEAGGIMAINPNSRERAKKEVSLLKFLKKNNASAADILFVLNFAATIPARAYAMENLWQLRQEGKLVEFRIYPMDNRKIQWAENHEIDPRVLAIATDIYGPTLKLIAAKPELFFEAAKDTKAKDKETYKYVPNPAVVARLQMSETGWGLGEVLNDFNNMGFSWDFSNTVNNLAFVNIGGVNAWDSLNLSPEWFPSGHNDLIWISQKLEESTGLPYIRNVAFLPGSARGYGDGSGGAIGPQLMPLNARLFMKWYEEANKQIGSQFPEANPFNPWTGIMLSYLYLSSEFYHRQLNVNDVLDVVRPGYSLLNDETIDLAYQRSDPRIKALLKWNPLYWEAETAVAAGDEYSDFWLEQETLTYNSD